MSQRLKCGLSRYAPGSPVGAQDGDGVSPETCWLSGIPVSCGRGGFTPRL